MWISPGLLSLVRINRLTTINMNCNELEWLADLKFNCREPSANDYWLFLIKYRDIKSISKNGGSNEINKSDWNRKH